MKFVKPLTLFKEVIKGQDMKLPGRFMCTHLGRGCVGLSISDYNNTSIPLATRKNKKALVFLQEIIPRYNVEGLVVAYAYPSIGNRVKHNGAQVKAFIDDMCKLGEFEGLKYTYWDERLTSKDAKYNEIMHGRLLSLRLGNSKIKISERYRQIGRQRVSDVYGAMSILKAYIDYASVYAELDIDRITQSNQSNHQSAI